MTRCRSCGSEDLRVFLALGNLPLSDGFLFTHELDREEARYPLDVAFCGDCTLVQILETVPPEELFGQDYPYYSSFTSTLLDHSRANVQALIASRELGTESLALEIASNDGYLLQYYAEAGVPCFGVDPAPGPVEAARKRGIETILAFFGLELAKKLRAERGGVDVLHANNVLAHVADTNGFVAGIREILADDGVAVIEVPYVRPLIEHREFDTIYHEHLCYFSVHALDALFARHGLVLQDLADLDIHGGSLRLFVGKNPAERKPRVDERLAEERRLGIDSFEFYADFATRVDELRASLRSMIQDIKARGGTIAGYGAAAKGTILLNACNLTGDLIDFVVDKNVHKQGRVIPGVRIAIREPEALLREMPDYTLILPWNFKDEILEQQAEYRARGGRFIVPVPQPVIV
ncbi:MAG: class I SAM-dependent methyltransferase [Planctomycetes bacterium]|nr:class I SAM-dependent methyltransferase [Planctomycetota bacterium]MCB9917590.1 class I SAM-dependent methyltransferase [Planctomycetota bacterium]